MRTRTMLSVLGVVAMLSACSGDVSDTGATLRQVDVEAMTSQTLYMALDLSEIPMTAAQLEAHGIAQDDAIPVRVEVFEHIAVAWFAPDGEAIIGRDTIMALWEVVSITAVTPIADRTASNESYVVNEPDEGTVDAVIDVGLANELPAGDREITELQPSPAHQALLDFADRLGTPDELPMLEELVTYHPGCL